MRVPYSPAVNIEGSLMPRLNMTLHNNGHSVEVQGIVDTGASINVLPYSIGESLGAIWLEQPPLAIRVDNLGRFESRALSFIVSHLESTVIPSVRLVFGWTRSNDVPILFGQVNFFMQFDVCFYRSQEFFEINPKQN